MEEHPQARYIAETLRTAGYIAYYAGGWVRDYLLKRPSDDIDIVTNALPETVQTLFERTVPIGISFGIILVIIDDRQYEVATFRSDLEYKDGRRPTKIVYSSEQEDAKRRDFTINGMFFDPLNEKILDFVDGKKDLEKRIIRAIGNPHERIKEDRLRMIRAVRIAVRFNFTIDGQLQNAIITHAPELFPAVAMERITQEFHKMKAYGSFRKALMKMHELTLLQQIFPKLHQVSTKIISERLMAIDNFPEETPLIAYLSKLFQGASLNDVISLCKYLKLPNVEIDFITFLYHTREFFSDAKGPIELYDWAHFYAHPFSQGCLHILAAEMDIFKRHDFLQENEEQKNTLSTFIERIQTKKPLVTSQHLKEENVLPGEKMGKLLKEAEKISINEKIEDPKLVIEKLKKTSLWRET